MSTSSEFEVVLSDQQRKAVESNSSAIVVLASAGSGKTEVIARRVERLLFETPNERSRILALSYTVKAAEELGLRLSERLGSLSDRVDAETIHGFAHDLLRQHGTKIGLPAEPELLTRDEDRVELMRRWSEEQGQIPALDPLADLREIDLLRARGETSSETLDWQAALASMHALDYPALLTAAQELLSIRSVSRQIARTYKHLIVDEAQNMTMAQYTLLTSVIGAPGETAIASVLVGDDKQSIVSFAGADPRLISAYQRDYEAERFELNINFRSATRLASLAQVVATGLGHKGVEEADHAAIGSVLFHEARDEISEAHFVRDWILDLLSNGIDRIVVSPLESTSVRPRDIAILGRSATALRQIGPALEKAGVPYTIASASSDWLESTAGKIVLELIALRGSVDHHSVHWQLARLLGAENGAIESFDELRGYLAESEDPYVSMLEPLCRIADTEEFVRALAALDVPKTEGPAASAWQADLEQLQNSWRAFVTSKDRAARSWSNFKLYCSKQQRGDDNSDAVRLLTIHKAQGREFKAVGIVGLNDGQLPDFRAQTVQEEQSERRTFYVAVTRPRRVLLMTRARARQTKYGTRRTEPSRYLALLEGLDFVERD
jgi:DNA helicase-2/ATP-dependent DNA helicase PcrA